MLAKTLALVACGLLGNDTEPDAPAAIRLVELNGDGRVDRLQIAGDGTLSVALNRGGRSFEQVPQSLPAVTVADVLVCDLDGDARTDLYLVSPGANAALVGDGTGLFADRTAELGLADAGLGLGAEAYDVDGDGLDDLVLHNQRTDVIFWATERGVFERDSLAPSLEEGVAFVPTRPQAARDLPTATEQNPAPEGGSRAVGDRVPMNPAAAGEVSGTPRIDASPEPTVLDAVAFPSCARTIRDVTTGNCLPADSTPTLGRLYPLGPEFFIDPAGRCGIGDLTPATKLDVSGTFRARGAYSNTVPVIENTGNTQVVLGAHTGGGSPVAFALREDSTNVNNSASYGTFWLARTSMNADGAGNNMYFQMPNFFGGEVEAAGLGARVEQGLSANTPYAAALDFYTSFNAAPRQRRMTVTGAGDVGIGTSTPAADLHVLGDASLGRILVAPDATANTSSELRLSEDAGGVLAFNVRYDGAKNQLQFQSDEGTPTTRLLITRSGGLTVVGSSTTSSVNGPGRFRVEGDVSQSLTSDGMVKAACQIDASGPSVTRQFNNLPGGGTITVTRGLTGYFTVNFGADVSGRFYTATLGTFNGGGAPPTGLVTVSPAGGSPGSLFVQTYSVGGGPANQDFYLVVY